MSTHLEYAHAAIRYVCIALAMCAVGLGGIIGVNALIDPFGMYRWADLQSVNGYRPAIHHRVRLMKAYDVRRIEPEAIVLGTSRSHLGLRMSHPGWDPSLTQRYNLAFDGATTKEMYYYLRHAHAVGPLKLVVLGLDAYHPLPVPAMVRPDFNPQLLLEEDSYLSDAALVLQDAKLLSSMHTLSESWRTLTAQSSAPAQWYGADGQRLGEVFFRRAGESFHDQGPRAYFDEINKLEVKFQLEWRIPAQETLPARFTPPSKSAPDETSLDYIRLILAFCRQHSIDLRIFLTPAHAHQLEITAAAGGWDSVERGKRALAELIEQDAAEHPDRPPIPLWDFSGYSTITTESLPAAGSRQEMKYYWDSSHFKQEVGDWVLDRIFDMRRPDSPRPEEFGVRLTAANVDEGIADLRDGHNRYRKTHRSEVDQLQSWVEDFVKENGIERNELVAGRL